MVYLTRTCPKRGLRYLGFDRAGLTVTLSLAKASPNPSSVDAVHI